MTDDIFGNLLEWGNVINILERLKKEKKLEEHQGGIARILRYRYNWKLQETTLIYIKDIVKPSEKVINEVLKVALDESTYYNGRILALEALTSFIKNGSNDVIMKEKIQKMLEFHQAPIFEKAINQFLSAKQ